jgi:methionyl-tRNA formyltransferase
MGSPALATPSLKYLATAGLDIAAVVTQPDRPAGRGMTSLSSPVAQTAVDLGLRVIKPQRLAADDIADLRPDFLVVAAFGQILSQAVLDIAPAVNLHTSLLPKLRGAAPIHHAILQGLKQTGVSTMLVVKKLDAGPILLQQSLDIDPQDTAFSLGERLAQLGPDLLLQTLHGLARGTITPRPQDSRQASYAPRCSREDGRVDWKNSARQIDCQTRGLYPWPGAFAVLGGKTIKLFPPTAILPLPGSFSPGAILNPHMKLSAPLRNMLWIACADAALGLAQAQAPGKKIIAGQEMAGRLGGA